MPDTRLYAETRCEHGNVDVHISITPKRREVRWCPGGVRREVTVDYEAACWALVDSHAVDAITEIGGLTLGDVILAVDAALADYLTEEE